MLLLLLLRAGVLVAICNLSLLLVLPCVRMVPAEATSRAATAAGPRAGDELELAPLFDDTDDDDGSGGNDPAGGRDAAKQPFVASGLLQ